MRISARGFTLVELLVVITIMGLVGAYTLSNYNTFGEDKKLKNAALDVQSLLRQAQTSAATGLRCSDTAAKGWRVNFTSTTALDLQCQYFNGTSDIWIPVKTLSYVSGNISVSSYTSDNVTSCTPTYAQFKLLYGTMTSDCSNALFITLINNKISADCSDLTKCKRVTIDPSGRIYE